MKTTFTRLTGTLLLAATLAAPAPAQKPIYQDESKPIEQRIKDALSRMTLEEKVALCHAQSKFTSPGVPRLGIPEIHMSDGPHGVRAEVEWNSWSYANWTNDSVTVFPALTALAATWNPEMSAIYGKAVGEEARYRNKNVLLGPGVNIYRTPLNGRNFEYMGEDPYLAGEMVGPYIQSLQSNGVAACVKHFALNNQETWRGSVNVTLSDRALYEIYLPAFKKAVEAGAWSIMGAYNQIWNQHCCHNERLLNKILKEEWGFDGVVITDWGGAHDTRQAALYGLDIEMGTYTNGLTSESKFGYNNYYLADDYQKGLKEGSLPMSSIDDKASRILRLIFRTSMNSQKPWGSLCTQEHYDVAHRIGNEAIVLLKNAPLKKSKQALLPIDAAKYDKILVVGDNATRRLNEGGGSSELKAKTMVSPLDALKELYGDKIEFAQGYACGRTMYEQEDKFDTEKNRRLNEEAVEKARKAGLVIFIGGLNKNGYQDTEATDRREYELPYNQGALIEQLAEANPNIVVVNISGNAVGMDWADKVPAILQDWYLGSMGGYSLSDVLSGKENPSGHLPYSIAAKLSDCGAHSFGPEAYPGVKVDGGEQEEYKEDIFVGYRWHDTKKIAARYPFGHGLSYTTFAYSKPTLSANRMAPGDKLTLAVKVTNTGERAGKETVQLYVSDSKCSLPRPAKELKGFKKIELQPGESKEVVFEIDEEMLKFYDPQQSGWVAEAGEFSLLVGASSADIKSASRIRYEK